MPQLSYRLNVDKLVNALVFFASHGAVTELTTLKAAKLLYLADRDHFFNHGRPITGDQYVAMDLGPVPGRTYEQLKSLAGKSAEPPDPKLRQAIGQRPAGKYPELEALQPVDLSVFSESDLESLRRVVERFGRQPASRLVDLTHRHRAYKRADAGRAKGSSVKLPYEYFLDDAPSASRSMELANERQQAKENAEAMRRAAMELRAR